MMLEFSHCEQIMAYVPRTPFNHKLYLFWKNENDLVALINKNIPNTL
jgi:hypothetical protein